MKSNHPDSQSRSFKRIGCTPCDLDKVHLKCFVPGRVTRIRRKVLNLKTTIDIGEEENPLRCEECEYYATRTDLLQNHIKSVHEKILRYSCAYCTYASFFRNTVRHHLKSTHPSEELYIKKIGCIECETDSNHSHTVERRAINQTSEQNCNLCGLKCSGNNALKRHLKASHPGTKMFKCDQCSYECNWRGKIRVHRTTLHSAIDSAIDVFTK